MSAAPERSIIAEISQVAEAIRELKDEQANALTQAVYLTMSKAETEAYDVRSEEIKELQEKLDSLKYSM